MSAMLFTLVGCAGTQTPYSKNNKVSYNQSKNNKSLLARVTVYWARGKGTDRDTARHNGSWIGYGKLKKGHCAVDPKKIPYGSAVRYPDGTVDLAVDTGGDVKNRKAARRAGRTMLEKAAIVVDKFFETKREALAWARINPMFIPVEVILPQAPRTQQNQQQFNN